MSGNGGKNQQSRANSLLQCGHSKKICPVDRAHRARVVSGSVQDYRSLVEGSGSRYPGTPGTGVPGYIRIPSAGILQ
eukprot:2833602-Rhodomonas_salina.1